MDVNKPPHRAGSLSLSLRPNGSRDGGVVPFHARATAALQPSPAGAFLAREAAQSAPRVGRLRLDIQRLSLPGYTPAQHERFMHALTTTLNQLMARQAPWPTALGARITHLDAGRLREGATPEDAAREIATQIFARLAGGAGDEPHV